MNQDSYLVTISRDQPWWVAAVDGVGTTRAKKVSELQDLVRDLIMVTRDTGKPGFDLVWDYYLPADAAEALKDYQRSRQERTAAEHRHLNDAERAADALDAANVSTREAAQLMQLSHQRVEQLRSRVRAR
jgi:hypothetical protein